MTTEHKQEIENLRYMASTLEYDHQVQTRNALLSKADILEEIHTKQNEQKSRCNS